MVLGILELRSEGQDQVSLTASSFADRTLGPTLLQMSARLLNECGQGSPTANSGLPQVNSAHLTAEFLSALPDANLVQLAQDGLKAAHDVLLHRHLGPYIRHAERARGVDAQDDRQTYGSETDQEFPRQSRGTPANWNPHDWDDEMLQLEAEIKLQVLHDYDSINGLSFLVVLRREIIRKSTARLRKERAFARRMAPMEFVPEKQVVTSEDPRYEEVREAVLGLTEQELQLILWRYWEGWTQAELGRKLHVSQPRVIKLISAALAHLRGTLDQSHRRYS